MMTDSADPGWQGDPTGRHEHRYWDGARWTDQVSDGGVTGTDPVDPEVGGGSSGRNWTVLAIVGGVAVVVLVIVGALLLTRGDDSGGGDGLEAISSVSEARTAVAAAGIGCDPTEPDGDDAASIEASAQFIRGALLDPDAPDPVEPTDGLECDIDDGRLAVYVFDEDTDATAYADLWSESTQSCIVTVQGRNWFAVAIHNINAGSPPAVAAGDSGAAALGGRVSETCGAAGGDGGGTGPADDTPDGGGGEAYPQIVVDNFMAACTAEGAPAASCRCTIDGIQQTVTLAEFAEFDQQAAATGVIAPEIRASLDACGL
jgi:hypothetical protein